MTDDRPGARKAGLSRESILRAAVRLADEDGVDGLSMRKLAEGFGATVMALYRYVANKDGYVLDVYTDCTTGMISFKVLGLVSVDYRRVSERALAVHRPAEACRQRGFETGLLTTAGLVGDAEVVAGRGRRQA